MSSLRTARSVARWMLAWFALYLGVAVASPLLTPGGYAVICSADGIARLVQTDDAGAPGDAHATLHCPLCVPAGTPPPVPALAATPPQPLAYLLSPVASARPAALTAAPPPARGPPPSA